MRKADAARKGLFTYIVVYASGHLLDPSLVGRVGHSAGHQPRYRIVQVLRIWGLFWERLRASQAEANDVSPARDRGCRRAPGR